MSEAAGNAEESRFDLQQMLKELQAESTRQVKGPVKQADIMKMFQNRRQREDKQDGDA
ncbi:MAG TPA: hypothetical protein VMB48_08925 [Steroidobacteraceae bacterium]|nr:hypothetical protein [Steroidobacteraceae bacterium]